MDLQNFSTMATDIPAATDSTLRREAQLWTQHKDDLLAAGLLTPTVKRVAADDGAGPYDVDSPGFGDYWMELKANGISNSGDFIGKTDAARHMDHYLNGTGSTLDLDVDRMLSDENDTVLRDVSALTRSKQEAEWRRQVLEAYAQSGGKPVAIPVETTGVGYTHDKGPDGTANWYLAVGSAMTNTTGVVTAVPGADGKPHVSIDYQVNVWDRYNWDPGKATPIGPTSVTRRHGPHAHDWTSQGVRHEREQFGAAARHDVGRRLARSERTRTGRHTHRHRPERGRPVNREPRSRWYAALPGGMTVLTSLLVAGCSGSAENRTPALKGAREEDAEGVEGVSEEEWAEEGRDKGDPSHGWPRQRTRTAYAVRQEKSGSAGGHGNGGDELRVPGSARRGDRHQRPHLRVFLDAHGRVSGTAVTPH
ncbi:hypothetical protein [Streptomyces marianii]|uniref:hypothetical protein n=1 Tax=Streptomyces marianii TaxID=1817406 RepID=UPI001486E98B|nr:hypothetical protein [Streptomyces marianii]